MIRLFRAVFVVVLVWAAPLPATASDDPLAGLDAVIEAAREQWHAPGLAVAIVKDDQVVYLRGFGTKHLGRNDPVDAHTVVHARVDEQGVHRDGAGFAGRGRQAAAGTIPS